MCIWRVARKWSESFHVGWCNSLHITTQPSFTSSLISMSSRKRHPKTVSASSDQLWEGGKKKRSKEDEGKEQRKSRKKV